MEKKYLVILQNATWNNLYYIGEFKDLKDAIPVIKEQLPENYELEELTEYPSTFGMCFDLEIYNRRDEDDEIYMVRGFILEDDNE